MVRRLSRARGGFVEELEVSHYDVWDDWLMRVLLWLAFAGFGWLVGWLVGQSF